MRSVKPFYPSSFIIPPVHKQTMVKVLPIAIASFIYVLVGFADAKDIDESSLSMIISSEELADFSLGGSLVGFLREPKPEPSGKSGKGSDAKSKESKSTKTKSSKDEQPETSSLPSEDPSSLPSEDPSSLPSEDPSSLPSEDPSSLPSEDPSSLPSKTPTPEVCSSRRALREGELPVQEDVPHERRLEIFKSMEPIGAKRDATFSQEYDLISKKSCSSLIQHVDTSLPDSGMELPVVKPESSFSYEDLCECVSCINRHSLHHLQTDVCLLCFFITRLQQTCCIDWQGRKYEDHRFL